MLNFLARIVAITPQRELESCRDLEMEKQRREE